MKTNKDFENYINQIKNKETTLKVIPYADIVPFCEYICKKKFKLKNSEEILLTALMLYLKTYRPIKEQTFESVVKMLIAFEVKTYKMAVTATTPIDRIFEEVYRNVPGSTSLKYYYNFRTMYQKDQEEIVYNLLNAILDFDSNLKIKLEDKLKRVLDNGSNKKENKNWQEEYIKMYEQIPSSELPLSQRPIFACVSEKYRHNTLKKVDPETEMIRNSITEKEKRYEVDPLSKPVFENFKETEYERKTKKFLEDVEERKEIKKEKKKNDE